MRTAVTWITQALVTFGLTLLAIVGLLLFAVLVRPLIVVAMAVMVGAMVVAVFNPAVRAWFEAPAHY